MSNKPVAGSPRLERMALEVDDAKRNTKLTTWELIAIQSALDYYCDNLPKHNLQMIEATTSLDHLRLKLANCDGIRLV